MRPLHVQSKCKLLHYIMRFWTHIYTFHTCQPSTASTVMWVQCNVLCCLVCWGSVCSLCKNVVSKIGVQEIIFLFHTSSNKQDEDKVGNKCHYMHQSPCSNRNRSNNLTWFANTHYKDGHTALIKFQLFRTRDEVSMNNGGCDFFKRCWAPLGLVVLVNQNCSDTLIKVMSSLCVEEQGIILI